MTKKKELNGREEMIYVDLIDFSDCNARLKGMEVTCCITGKKFQRGDNLEFHLGFDPENKKFVCQEEAEKLGYVLSEDFKNDLYGYLHSYNALSERTRRIDQLRSISDEDLITSFFRSKMESRKGMVLADSDPDMFHELSHRGYIHDDKLVIAVGNTGDPTPLEGNPYLPF